VTIDEISGRIASISARPQALFLTALDGTGQHTALLQAAGGTPCASLDDQPEVLLLALPDLSLDDAEEEAFELAETPGWLELPCVKGGDCYLIDSAQLTDEAQATWILATILHPEIFTEMLPPYSVRMFPPELYKKTDDA
jgi:ABC-type Fe3+-hydroxamate transport system substrate-binding protein